jgi:hypothetical protein
MDPDEITWPGPTMAAASYRALFAVLVDALFAATREQRHAVIDAMGGLTSGHLMVAIAQSRMRCDVRLEDDGAPWLWVLYPVEDAWQPVVACSPHAVGADPALLMREQEWLMEDALREILGGAL